MLGQIAVQALEATGASVGGLTTITGSTNVRNALTAGEVDMYWEYTGTGWTTHMQHEPQSAPKGDQALYDAVAAEDKGNGIAWLAPAPVDNTYAVATAQGRDQQLGVRTLSEYAALVNRDPAQGRMCAAAEFLTRDDGWPGLEQTYGFDLPDNGVAELELSLVPQEIASGDELHLRRGDRHRRRRRGQQPGDPRGRQEVLRALQRRDDRAPGGARPAPAARRGVRPDRREAHHRPHARAQRAASTSAASCPRRSRSSSCATTASSDGRSGISSREVARLPDERGRPLA